jgi:hypothetical protein
MRAHRIVGLSGRVPGLVLAGVMALAVMGAGCTGGGRSGVEGVLQYRVCGGAPPPEGVDPCRPPTPAAGTVTVSRGEVVVARARADSSGRWRVTLPAGTYTVEGALGPEAPYVDCPPAEITVPTAAPVTLTCSLLAP